MSIETYAVWRLADINARMPSARFLTIQFVDGSVADFRKDWRDHYASLFANETDWQVTITGIAFGRWRTGPTP